jgi:hypothetical protein
MVTEDKKRTAHRALKDRILNGEGTAPRDLRARAFDNAGLPPPLDALLGKAATRPTQVTEADLAAAKASGFSEDQLFELVVCAAVGQSTRLYEAGLAQLVGRRSGADGGVRVQSERVRVLHRCPHRDRRAGIPRLA